MKKRRYTAFVLLILLVGICCWLIGSFISDSIHNKNENSELHEIAYCDGSPDAATTTDYIDDAELNNSVSEISLMSSTTEAAVAESTLETDKKMQDVSKSVNIETLQDVNPDIFAWIKVPGTVIDYPVVQHPRDDEFYLKHGADGMKSSYGCPYIELCDSKSLDDFNTVIYGHNMNNGSMFGGLHKFEDQSFYDDHREIFVYTSEHVYSYEIFAAVLYSDDYIPYCYDDASENERLAFLESLKTNNVEGHSIISDDVAVGASSKILTLSTCDKVFRNNFTMCGIVGFIGKRQAAPILLDGLNKLEYRG